jgi:hypothetical protein
MKRKSLGEKSTWSVELRGPVLTALVPAVLKFEKSVGPIPKCFRKPWVSKIAQLIEASINKTFNLSGEIQQDAMALG